MNVTNPIAPSEHRDVSKIVNLRVSDAEYAAMKDAADKSGLTLSEWVRQRCLTIKTTIEAPVISSGQPKPNLSSAKKRKR